jgi:acyl-CoA thioesterase
VVEEAAQQTAPGNAQQPKPERDSKVGQHVCPGPHAVFTFGGQLCAAAVASTRKRLAYCVVDIMFFLRTYKQKKKEKE